MPNWLMQILIVWAYRPRSLYLIIIGLAAWLIMPLIMEWYWSGVHLEGVFKTLEEPMSEKFILRSQKVGLWMMIGCFISAYKVYKKDCKKL
jgi:hypothetical protein